MASMIGVTDTKLAPMTKIIGTIAIKERSYVHCPLRSLKIVLELKEYFVVISRGTISRLKLKTKMSDMSSFGH